MRFRTKTILGVAAIEMVLLAILVSSVLSILRESNQDELTRRVRLGGELLAAAAKDAVISQDLATLDSLVDAAMMSHQIDRIRILDGDGVVLTERGDEQMLARSFKPEQGEALGNDGYLDWSTPVMAGGIKQGEVQLSVPVAPLEVLLQSAQRWAAGIAVLEMSLVAVFSWLLGSYLVRQLSALREASQHFGSGDFEYRVPEKGNDELAQTAVAFNQMARLVGESLAALKTENRIRLEAQERAETSRNQAEDRNEQLNLIFALSPDGIVSFDSEHRVKFASSAFTRLTGLERDEITGLDEVAFSQRLAELTGEPAPHMDIAHMRSTEARSDDATPHRVFLDTVVPRKRTLELSLHESKARSVSQILYFRDITYESEVDRMKSEFLSTAAHELRTPMSCIFGYTELLLHRELGPDERNEFLKVIYSQSKLMIEVVNELLDLARIEARRDKDFVLVALNLAELLGEVLANYKPLTGRARPKSSAPLARVKVSGDRIKLIQTFSNILSNAYKYSPAGGDVRIDTFLADESVLDGRPAVGVRISDQGIGMSVEAQSRIFERFYRADSSGNIPGTGLGMSIVKEIVELHGGKVTLDSTEGKGTQVTVWLPIMEASD